MAHHDPRDYVLGQELRVRILTTGADTSGRHDLVDAFQLPETATPLHLHTRYEERLFVLEGACTVWVGPDTVLLGPGDYCSIPLNTPHAIKAGPNGCHSLLIASPAGFAELIARAAAPAQLAGPDTKIDLERFASVSSELGDQILGPTRHRPRRPVIRSLSNPRNSVTSPNWSLPNDTHCADAMQPPTFVS